MGWCVIGLRWSKTSSLIDRARKGTLCDSAKAQLSNSATVRLMDRCSRDLQQPLAEMDGVVADRDVLLRWTVAPHPPAAVVLKRRGRDGFEAMRRWDDDDVDSTAR